jgi:hypothetical protein
MAQNGRDGPIRVHFEPQTAVLRRPLEGGTDGESHAEAGQGLLDVGRGLSGSSLICKRYATGQNLSRVEFSKDPASVTLLARAASVLQSS